MSHTFTFVPYPIKSLKDMIRVVKPLESLEEAMNEAGLDPSTTVRNVDTFYNDRTGNYMSIVQYYLE